MNVKYHLRLMYENRYKVEFEIQFGAKTLKFETTTRYDGFLLKDLLRQAQTTAAGCVSQRKKWDNNIPAGTRLFYYWDGDASEMDERMQKQAEKTSQRLRVLPLEQIKLPEIEQEPRLLEVVKVNDVWTIKKHESQLLTWEEACAELKKKLVCE